MRPKRASSRSKPRRRWWRSPPRSGGTVTEILVSEGDEVNIGDVIARVETEGESPLDSRPKRESDADRTGPEPHNGGKAPPVAEPVDGEDAEPTDDKPAEAAGRAAEPAGDEPGDEPGLFDEPMMDEEI